MLCACLMSHVVTQDSGTCHLALFILQSLPLSLSICPFQILELTRGRLRSSLCGKLLLRSCRKSRAFGIHPVVKAQEIFLKLWLGSLYSILHLSVSQYSVKSSQDGTRVLSVLKCSPDNQLKFQVDVRVSLFPRKFGRNVSHVIPDEFQLSSDLADSSM